jgi:hypothetical protein
MARDWPAALDFAIQARDRLDSALERVLRDPVFEGVYLGPWWDLPAAEAPAAISGWKRAVLRRVMNQGAEHWGHLFLLVSSESNSVILKPEPNANPNVSRLGPFERIGRISPFAILFARSSRPHDSDPLMHLAAETVQSFLSSQK